MRVAIRFVIVALAIWLVALTPLTAQTPALIPVHVGGLATDDAIALYYAQRTGLFAKAGLDVQFDHSSPNGAAVAAAVNAGSYDIGKSTVSSLIDAHLRGLPFTLIATAAVYDSKAPYSGLIVAKDSPIKTGKDLEGKAIALISPEGPSRIATNAWLENSGPHVKNLGGNTQALRDLAQNIGRRFTQPTFHLAQIWIADTSPLSKLSHRDLGGLALAPDEAADVGSRGGHLGGELLLGCHCVLLVGMGLCYKPRLQTSACFCKHLVSTG